MQIVTVGEREFSIGKPSIAVYLGLIKLIARVYADGRSGIVKNLGAMSTFVQEPDNLFIVAKGLQDLQPKEIEELTALLLHFENVEEGVAFVRKVGWDLAWFVEVLAANAAELELASIISGFRKLVDAASSQLQMTSEETAEGAEG